jgi:outer membrane usher protein
MVRVFVLPFEGSRVSASYDSLNRSATASAFQGYSNGVQRWEADLNTQMDDRAQQKVAEGSLLYAGNRGEVRIAQSASMDDLGGTQVNGLVSDRSSVRFGTAIAFADGRVAMGPPVRGNGFAIVYPHDSLADKAITVGDPASPRAFANGLGPALITDLPAYVPNNIPVDVKDLPPGYSLGNGTFDVVPPYRGGYALQVGSANSVSAYGTLLRSDRQPLALTTGVASPEARREGAGITVFTNRSGRFVAEGLAPGSWLIEMATEDRPTYYRIEVPSGAQGIVRAGVLTPLESL